MPLPSSTTAAHAPRCRYSVDRSLEDGLPAGFEAHIQSCKPCRLYAEGLRTAPLVFSGRSLYGLALKHRCLTALPGFGGSGDLKLGLLMGVPIALTLLLSFFIQVYVVHMTLARAINAAWISCGMSIASVLTVGMAAGAVCLSALIRQRTRSDRIQEVYHD